MKKYANKIATVLLLIFIAVTIYLISSTYMMAPDEYNYSHISWTDTKLNSFSDIITSEMSMYQQWTGRIPVHTIIQSMLYLGAWIYQIINPIMFIVFILLLGNIIFSKPNYFKVVLATFLIIFEILGLGEKFIWMSGSVNYLWTTTMMLILMCYYYAIFEKDKKLNFIQILFFWIVSFLAGWSQENVVFILGSFIIVIGIKNFKKFLKMNNKQKAYIILSILLFGIGVILLIFAPGNFKRMNTTESKLQITNIIQNFKLIGNLIGIYIISLFGLVFTNGSKENIKKEEKSQIWKNQILFILPMFIGLLPMVIIAEFPVRAMLPYEAMIIVLTVSNAQYIVKKLEIRKIRIILSVLLTFAVGYELCTNVIVAQKYMKPYKEDIQNRVQIAQNAGEKEVILPKFTQESLVASKKINLLVDFSPKTIRTNIINTYMSIYYGFDSIETISDDEVLVKVYFNKQVPNIAYAMVDTNGQEIRKSIVEDANETTNLVTFIMLKSEKDLVKLELPEEIKSNITNIRLDTIEGKENIEIEKIIK